MQSAMQPDMQQNASLDLARIADFLGDCGRPDNHPVIDFYPVVDSTMRLAHTLALRAEIRSGSVVVADAQSAGRGRLGRQWQAPAGTSLLMSLIIKQPESTYNQTLVPVIAGLALQRTVEELRIPGVAVGLKWPNDLLLRTRDGVERKVAGILVESTLDRTGDAGHVIVGIGVNVLQTAAQLPAVAPPAPQPTSLQLAGAGAMDRTQLLINLCRNFWEIYALGNPVEGAAGKRRLMDGWRNALWTLGRDVSVHHADGTLLHGTAVDIDDAPGGSGALIVAEATGVRHIIHSGDVSLRAD